MKNRYKDRIHVKAGLEVDFHPDFVDACETIIKTFAFDLIGGSVHFLNGLNVASRKYNDRIGKHHPDILYDQYLAKLDAMLDHDYFDMVCHLDLMKKFNPTPEKSYGDRMARILSRIREKGVAVEFNTGGYGHPVGEAYPSVAILTACKKANIPVTLSSDAHRPNQVGRHFNKALEVLRSIGYTHLSTFKSRTRYEVPIEISELQ
jgi:histidinol-phosphatase (PHP family)